MTVNSSAPPYSNRGVQNTWRSGLIASVDWVSVTFKNVNSVQNVIDFLGFEFQDFVPFDHGKYGYNNQLRHGHIAIYYSDVRPHIFLEMSGQGCREFEEFSNHSWSVFFGLVLMLDVNIPRLDIAIDDYQGYLKFSTLKRKIKSAEVTSRFKKAREVNEYEISTGKNTGETIYFGSPQSLLQVRFYDKLKERLSKGTDLSELNDIHHWIRTEVQLRDERAAMAAIDLSRGVNDNEIGKEVAGILRNNIQFRVKSADSNKSRWPIAKFWEKFLHDVEPIKLTQIAPEATVQRSKAWIEHDVLGSLVTVLEAFDYDPSLLAAYIQEGYRKRSRKHEAMLKRFTIDRDFSEVEANKNKLLDLLLDKKKNDDPGRSSQD